MKKINDPVQREIYKPSQREALDLSEKLKAFTPKVVNGRKQYPFELFLESQQIIRFDKFGMIQVVNPQAYKKYIDINSLRQWIDEQEMERMFQAFPEERVAYEKKVRAMFADIKSLFKAKTA
jgi:hypothetical protein